MNILITGCAGFIGYHLSEKFLKNKKNKIIGIDNLNNYYSVSLKKKRLNNLKKNKNFIFFKNNLEDFKKIDNIFTKNKIDYVYNLAAQAGVRYSISNPDTYFNSNVVGFYNIINLCLKYKVKNLFFASSSSVYGNNVTFPLKEEYNTDNPLSFYGATKKINEIIAASYANIYNLNSTALRFFTVYGPYGRPDMALYKFTKNILENKKIDLYNKGNHIRDFTYIDDVVESLVLLFKVKKNNTFEVYNIAGGKPESLKKYIKEIEKNLKLDAKFRNLSLQKGDIVKTHASSNKLSKAIKYKPKTRISKGIENFIKWYVKENKK